jgi:hypothetical protein
MDMRFGTWNIRTIYRGRFTQDSGKKYQNMLDFVGVQEVGWDRGGAEPAGECTVA